MYGIDLVGAGSMGPVFSFSRVDILIRYFLSSCFDFIERGFRDVEICLHIAQEPDSDYCHGKAQSRL